MIKCSECAIINYHDHYYLPIYICFIILVEHFALNYHLLGGKLCASTLIVSYEDKEIKLGIQRSCAAESREEGIYDGNCHTNTVTVTFT